ncbi:hypothetical protein EWM64_g4953 [Hericium alpestre]|uniref:Uncharacterized protein n=1 Tax=Hericium alpestre TaxID=135208 RepID=A0A4Y9ZXZ6_9AGAM|nr:hypothetical protein EWM64_g4953 [Hericium alpestre]
MRLLEESRELRQAIRESFGSSSAEMTEFLQATDAMGLLVDRFAHRSPIILNAFEWLSVIRQLVKERKKGLLACGILTELIEAHMVMAEYVRGRRSDRKLALDQIKPRPSLVEDLTCLETADWCLKWFTDSCMWKRINREASGSDFSSPFFPVRALLALMLHELVNARTRREKRVDEVERELAEHIGARLVEKMVQWRKDGGAGEWTKYVARTDDSPTALTLLQAITFAFTAHASKLSGDAPSYALLLTSSPSSQNFASTTVVMLLGSDDKRVKEVGDELKKQFKTLKGGGRGPRWSGKSVGVWLADREGKVASLALTQPSAARGAEIRVYDSAECTEAS